MLPHTHASESGVVPSLWPQAGPVKGPTVKSLLFTRHWSIEARQKEPPPFSQDAVPHMQPATLPFEDVPFRDAHAAVLVHVLTSAWQKKPDPDQHSTVPHAHATTPVLLAVPTKFTQPGA